MQPQHFPSSMSVIKYKVSRVQWRCNTITLSVLLEILISVSVFRLAHKVVCSLFQINCESYHGAEKNNGEIHR